VDASSDFSAAQFQKEARQVVEDIDARGKTALLVGGTGLYFEAVVNAILFPPGSADDELRHRLQQESSQDLPGLRERLARIDPTFASGQDFANPRRVVRAMEVYERTGRPFSFFQEQRGKQAPFYDFCGVAFNAPRQALYGAIEARVDAMFAAGLVEEVRQLACGGGLSHTARQALGYKEVLDHLDMGISLEETIVNIKRRSRNYAKRQLTWLRRIPGLYWLELDGADLVNTSQQVITAARDHLQAGLS
jgi:tRNA dimethylallyltransferase